MWCNVLSSIVQRVAAGPQWLKRLVRATVSLPFVKPFCRWAVRVLGGTLSSETRFTLRCGLEKIGRETTLRWDSGEGTTIFYPSRSLVGIRVSEYGYWESPVFSKLVRSHLADAQGCIEVGGNIGVDTVFLAKTLPSQCVIEVFEPVGKFREYLHRNLRQNGCGKRVHVYSIFLTNGGDSSRSIDMNVTGTSASAVSPPCYFPTLSVETVSATSLDDFMRTQSHIVQLDFLKIDTDGFDQHVVEGGAYSIRRHLPYLWVEFAGPSLEEAGRSSQQFASLLRDVGYREFVVVSDKEESEIVTLDYDGLRRHVIDVESSVDVFAMRPL